MSTHSDPELLANSCQLYMSFPMNIVRHTTPQHHLEGYVKRLDEHDHRIFCEDGMASLAIWEYDDNVRGIWDSDEQLISKPNYCLEFKPTRASSVFELNGRLRGINLYDLDDPRCRFM